MAEKIGSLEFDIIGVDNLTEVTEATKKRIEGLVDSTVKGGSAMDDTFNKIKSSAGKTFGDINNVIQTNESEIRTLKSEYDRLGEALTQIKKVENLPGNDKSISEITDRRIEIEKEITMRRGLVDEAKKSSAELSSLEEKTTAKVKVNADAHTALRTQIRAAREELSAMEMQGLRGTESYSVLQTKLGELTDQMMDTQAQASILANDQRGFQGIITGLGGISGAMSAAGGVYGMFAGENENLQKIMTKVQSLMAITIGLQQISQALDKDSAFMLVTVNGLKKWWNEITGKSVIVETAEAVATKAATAAKKGQTGEIVKGTAATAGNTVATTTGTVATKGLAGGFKAVGLAIKSIPGIGWLIAVITGVVAAFTLLNKKQKEARVEQEKFTNSVAEIALEPIAKINELSSSYSRLGTSMKEKEKFVKDNQKAFNDLGVSVKTVADAENLLIKNKDAFIRAQIAKAKATVVKDESKDLIMLQVKAESKLDELKTKYKDYERKETTDKYALEPWEKEIQLAELEVRMAEAGLKARFGLAQEYSEKAEEILDEAGIKGASESKTSGAYKSLLEKIKEQYDIYSKAIKSTDETTREAAKEKYKTLIDYAETYLLYLEKERNKLLEIEKSGKKLTTSQKANLDNINKEIAELTQPDNKNDKSAIAEHSYTLQKEKIIQKYQKDIEDIKSKVGTVDIETGLTIDQKTVDEAIKEITKKKNKELEDLMNSFYPKTDFSKLLDEYADFEQQRNAIAKKYKDIRDKMHEQNASDIKAGIPVTFKDENFKSVDSKETEDIAAVNKKELDVLISQSSKMMDIFTRIQALSKSTASEAIKNAKAISDYITSNGTTLLPEGIDKEMVDKLRESPEELAIFYDRLSAMQEEYREQSKNPFDEIIYGIGSLKLSYELLTKAESETNEETAKTLRLQAKIAKDKGLQTVYNYANKAANGLQMMTQAMREYGEASGDTKLIEQAEVFGAIADNIISAAEGFKSGSWIGAIIGGGSNLLSGFINSFTAAKAQAVKLKQALDDIATAAKNANYEMLMSGESRENYFGTDSYGKFLDAIEAEKEASKALNDALGSYTEETLYGNKKGEWYEGMAISLFTGFAQGYGATQITNSFKTWEDAVAKGYQGLETMSIKTKSRNGFMKALGFKDETASLKDVFPNLFNSDGTLNIDELEKIKASDIWEGTDTFTNEQKEALEQIAEAQEMVNKAIAAQKEYLSGLFSSLGNEISDAMWTAAKEGTNATQAIGEALDKMIENFAKQMIYSKVLQPYFDQMENTINYKLDKGQSMESIMGWMATRIQEDMGWYEEEYKRVFDAFGKKFGGKESSLATLSGAIKGASQESIDLLAGQTNAVRLNQVEAIAIQRTQLYQLTLINGGIGVSNEHLLKIYNLLNKNTITPDPYRATGKTYIS